VWQAWETKEERTGLWVWKPEGKRPTGRPWRRKEVILKWILKKLDWKTWTRLIWIKDRDRWLALESAVTNPFGFHEMWGISRQAEELSFSRRSLLYGFSLVSYVFRPIVTVFRFLYLPDLIDCSCEDFQDWSKQVKTNCNTVVLYFTAYHVR